LVFVPKPGAGFFPVDKRDATALDVVITTVESLANLRLLTEALGKHIVHEGLR
jgi:hypothetical protein